MKTNFLTTLPFALAILSEAKTSFAQSCNYVAQFGGTCPDVGRSIVTDGSGNIYTTGYFFGTVDFDINSLYLSDKLIPYNYASI